MPSGGIDPTNKAPLYHQGGIASLREIFSRPLKPGPWLPTSPPASREGLAPSPTCR